jgi:HPr kinase/phosphorylase
MKGITVQELLDDTTYDLQLEFLSGSKGISRRIYNSRIQKPGLVIAGHMVYLHPHRVQILGYTEISYLRQLEWEEAERIIKELCSGEVACFIVTRNLKVPQFLLTEVEQQGVALLRTKLLSSIFIERVSRYLEDKLAPSAMVHGVLMEILGVGVLILGRSGIGKSENALDLIWRGHRLVTDDVVEVKKKAAVELLGESPKMTKNLLEIRGIGIVDVQRLFGVTAVRDRKRIDMVVELVDWDNSMDSDRVGLREDKYRLLGVDLPLMRIPVSPGRNAAAIIELACRNHLLKKEGVNTARELEERVLKVSTAEVTDESSDS